MQPAFILSPIRKPLLLYPYPAPVKKKKEKKKKIITRPSCACVCLCVFLSRSCSIAGFDPTCICVLPFILHRSNRFKILLRCINTRASPLGIQQKRHTHNPQAYRLLKQGQTDKTDGHWLTASDKPHAGTFPIIQVIQYGVSAPSPGIIRTYVHTYIHTYIHTYVIPPVYALAYSWRAFTCC
jgi:hypothetical protein